MEASRVEITEAADLLGITVRSVQRLISLERLPAEKVPRGPSGWKYLIPLSALPPEVQDNYLKCRSDDQPRSSTIRIADKRHLPARTEKSALARADLLGAWHKNKKIAISAGSIADALGCFLLSYNTGHLLPEIFKVLGTISRGTLYRWEKAYKDGDNDYRALAPGPTNKRGVSKVTEDEANLLLTQLLHQNQVKVETAIKLTKYILERRGLPSPSSGMTLRRFVDNFKKRHYDLWIALREGEKAVH